MDEEDKQAEQASRDAAALLAAAAAGNFLRISPFSCTFSPKSLSPGKVAFFQQRYSLSVKLLHLPTGGKLLKQTQGAEGTPSE